MAEAIFKLVREILFRLTSGRFIFTVLAAMLLFYGTNKGVFAPDVVLSIIKDVVIFYFIVKHAKDEKGE